VHAAFTHAVMAPGAEERLKEAKFATLLTTDSIPVEAKPWLEIVSIAPLLTRVVRDLTGVGTTHRMYSVCAHLDASLLEEQTALGMENYQ
jgi:phosphoribosylpyrophosphate synthetase